MGTNSNPLINILRNLGSQTGMHHDGTPEIKAKE